MHYQLKSLIENNMIEIFTDIQVQFHNFIPDAENLRNGLLSFWFLSCPWSFRIAPPLTITMEEAADGVAIILASMTEAK